MVSGDYSLAVVHRLFTGVASLVVGHGQLGAQASAVVHGLSCPMVSGIFLDQGSNPCPLHWQVNSLPLDHQGSPEYVFKRRELFQKKL